MSARLAFEEGTFFKGSSFGADASVSGEVVFNTGMVGYPEGLSDPSYRGQILVLTYPLVGSYGIPKDELDEFGLHKFFESEKVQVAGLVVSEYVEKFSHWNGARSLGDWLKEHGVPGISRVDTRLLTKKLREKGVMLGKILNGKDVELADPNKRNLVAEVCADKKTIYNKNGSKRVLLVDCGVKLNIIRSLVKRDCCVVRVPWNHSFLDEDYDAILISNGPGDPTACRETIRNVKAALSGYKPILGICLGNQILALAAGGRTYKLKYGHRGQNQPCVEIGGRRCYITSQNHGFAVDASSLSREWQEWFVNANDGTNEGIKHKSKPFFGFQSHPEASPGPVDSEWVFDKFLGLLK